ncbi:hypothetical protein [Polaribacter sp. Hel1_85]|uniref:hypothetical protein n=1 Tax=Polaribacter sp. Hel1_85 TaxID=1250005 RepID=UPI00052BF639|nr:hypothetical protein [Polaribacter sp. Hel1_85]KGL61916.1 hypothetical protein PHEL85_1702 [Polaribacter sp. Hel1_85]
MVNYYTTIPAELCEYALINRKVNHTKLYLLLKLKSSGHIKYELDVFECAKDWADELQLNYKTVLNCFKWLIREKWITINSISKAIHIKGYPKLFTKLNFKSKTAIIYEPESFSDFKAFCCAVVIIFYRNRKRYFQKQSVANMERATTNCKTYPKGFYTISCNYLAECLGVSKKTAYNYKNEAHKIGFITKKKNLVFITNDKGERLTNAHFHSYKFYKGRSIARRIRRGKKYLKIVEADLIKSNIHLKKKRVL